MSSVKKVIDKHNPHRQIIFKGECIDNEDPKKLGRIRAIEKTENSYERQLANETDGLQNYTDWGDNDPFLYKPLLPFFINTPPQKGEFIRIFYSNLDKKGSRDKYYIGGLYSNPTKIKGEPYNSAITNLDEGSRNKSFRDLLNSNGDYFNKNHEGVYAEPNDIALYGRGDSDIIVKENTVLLRSGRSNPTTNYPVSNNKRAFIQLSNYSNTTVAKSPEEIITYDKEHKNIRYLIEYNVTNPENNENNFSGHITIYYLNIDDVDTEFMAVTTKIEQNLKQDVTTISYSNKGKDELGGLIKDVINGFVKNDISDIFNKYENVTLDFGKTRGFNERFPFYYRPQLDLYQKVYDININSDFNTSSNMIELFARINLFDSISNTEITTGFGLIVDSDKKTDVGFSKNSEVIIKSETLSEPKSVNIIGSDQIYLISHNSQKKGKEKINMEGTIYGIDERTVYDEIEPKTSSLVRGEELMELLRLMKRFLFTHVHPWHQSPPNSQGLDGIKKSDIQVEIENAMDKILNKNIRIN